MHSHPATEPKRDRVSGRLVAADRAWIFWTMTAWDSQASMRRYMTTGSHRVAMPLWLNWCGEASVVHWEQPDGALPTWTEAHKQMRENGRASKVRHPSTQRANLHYRNPRISTAGAIKPAKQVQ